MADTQPLAPAPSAPFSQATTQVTTAPLPRQYAAYSGRHRAGWCFDAHSGDCLGGA